MKAEGWRSHHTPPTPTPRLISFKKSTWPQKLNPNPNPNPNSISNPKLPIFINPDFTDRRHWHLHTTTVYSLSSAITSAVSAAAEWPYAAVDGAPQLLHPLTFKPHRYNHPLNLHLFNHKTNHLTSFDRTHDFPFDTLVIPPPTASAVDGGGSGGAMVVLHGGGQLVGKVPMAVGPNWVELSGERFDDIVVVVGKTYVVDREGGLYKIFNNVVLRELRLSGGVITKPVVFGSGRVGWRKRLVVEKEALYLVVRVEEKVFKVYRYTRGSPHCWDEVKVFEGVLFVSKECCFFMDGFGGSEYRDCVVFSEEALPKYGSDGGWEYSGEDGFGVFNVRDGRYGRVGESGEFPVIDWSPPSWVFDVGQEMEDEEMSNANIEGDTSLQEDVPPSLFASVSAVEEEVMRTLLRMNGGNEPTEKESSSKNATLSAPTVCTSSPITKGYEGDCSTTNFKGFDIRSGLVPTLIKIWGKHGNIIDNSTIRSRDLIARALELLATMVQILESNSVESLSDCQADYLSSTLSDLKIMSFNVDWLSSFVEKAVKLHKRQALVDSLNMLGHLSYQVEENRAMLLDKVAKLTEEENKLKEEMTKVSEAISLSEQDKFDEPLGLGLT